MSTSVLIPSEIDCNNITYHALRKVGQNTNFKACNITYTQDNGEEGDFYVQFPKMRLAFNGVSHDNKEDPDKPKKFSISLSFSASNIDKEDEEPNKIAIFQQAIANLDEFNIEQGIENSVEWFGSSKPREVVEEKYGPILKTTANINKQTGLPWAPTMKTKLPMKKGNPDFQVFNKKKEICSLVDSDGNLDLGCIEKGAEVTGIFRFRQIWHAGSRYGCSAELRQLRVFPKHNDLAGYCIREDSDCSDNDENEDDEEEDFTDEEP